MTKTPPRNLERYLQVLVAFTGHKSIMVSSFTLPLWAQLLRHDVACKNPHVLACLEPLLKIGFERVVRQVANQ